VRLMAVENTRRIAGESAPSTVGHGRRDEVQGHQDAGLDAPRVHGRRDEVQGNQDAGLDAPRS